MSRKRKLFEKISKPLINETKIEENGYPTYRRREAQEAYWRLEKFKVHKEFPKVQRLDIHLENAQIITFRDEDSAQQA